MTSGLLGLSTVAFATFVLTTTISGATAFADSTAAIKVTAASVSDERGGVTCHAKVVNDDGVQVDPKVRRVKSGSHTATLPGSCKISLTVHNTGTEALELSGTTFTDGPPAGWTLSRPSVSDARLAGGASGTLSAVVTASDAATVGPFAFKITWVPQGTAR